MWKTIKKVAWFLVAVTVLVIFAAFYWFMDKGAIGGM